MKDVPVKDKKNEDIKPFEIPLRHHFKLAGVVINKPFVHFSNNRKHEDEDVRDMDDHEKLYHRDYYVSIFFTNNDRQEKDKVLVQIRNFKDFETEHLEEKFQFNIEDEMYTTLIDKKTFFKDKKDKDKISEIPDKMIAMHTVLTKGFSMGNQYHFFKLTDTGFKNMGLHQDEEEQLKLPDQALRELTQCVRNEYRFFKSYGYQFHHYYQQKLKEGEVQTQKIKSVGVQKVFENVNNLPDRYFGMYKQKDIKLQKCVVINDEIDNKVLIIGLKAGPPVRVEEEEEHRKENGTNRNYKKKFRRCVQKAQKY